MRNRTWTVSVALASLTLAVYWPLSRFGYFAVDDNLYSAGNRFVQGGLNSEGIAWAFTSLGYAANWHPLTWLSLMSDVQLFGAGPRGHHLVNVLLHTANAVMAYLALRSLTGTHGKSALTAAFFAIHPLHIESVAWISERKDVLSGFLWLLTLALYARYARRPGPANYLAVFSCMALGLMAKPMAVTLPFALLLLDWWPLGRLSPREGRSAAVLLEKIPLLALSAASVVLTLLAQLRGGLVAPLAGLSVGYRIANALVSYTRYLGKLLLPFGLSFWYPHPGRSLPLGEALAAGILLVVLSAAAVAAAKRSPLLSTGWFWYLGTLVPVIGIVQVGAQAMADRYTYLPSLGVTVALIWSGSSRMPRSGASRSAAIAGWALALCALGLMSRIQVATWESSERVFTRALDVTPKNWVMHNNLGELFLEQGRDREAAVHFQEAARLMPRYPGLRSRLALALANAGQIADAIRQYEELIRVEPDSPSAYFALGNLLAQQGRLDRAAVCFLETVRRDPRHDGAQNNLGTILLRQGRVEEALTHFRAAIGANPRNAEALNNLGAVLSQRGESSEALLRYQEALRVRPGYVTAIAGLARTYAAMGNRDQALVWFRETLRLDPNHAEAGTSLRKLSGASSPGR